MKEYLSQDKKVLSRGLYEEVFPEDSKEFLDYYFYNKIKNHKILVKYIHNDIVGMLHCNPHLLSIKGKKEEIEYIYAVATKKDYRKQGIMNDLLVKALQDMHAEGKSFTYLIPVAEKIYSPYGFTYVSSNPKMTIERKGFLMAASVNVVTLTDINNSRVINELIEFSNRTLEKEIDIFSYRSLSYYQDILSQLKLADGQIELLYQEGKLVGYCYLNGKGSQTNIQEIVCHKKDLDFFIQTILEKYYLDTITVKGVLGLSSPGDGFCMARILNLEKFFSYIRSNEEMELVVGVSDPVIEENNGVFLWKCNRYTSVLEPSSELPSYQFTISELTSWLFGYNEKLARILPKVKGFSSFFVNEEV